MLKVSEIISLPIISLYEGDHEGIIYNILFDKTHKKAKYFCILDEIKGIENIIELSKVYTIGKDCVFIKNKSQIDLEFSCENTINKYIPLLNLKVYNLDGDFLGHTSDVKINKQYKINKIILNNDIEIDHFNIINIGKSIILVNNHKIKISNFRPRIKSIINYKNDNKVVILSSPTNNNVSSSTPNKVITNKNMLLGRKISKDIINTNGEIIAKKDTIITNDIINKSNLFGKLVELTRYSEIKN